MVRGKHVIVWVLAVAPVVAPPAIMPGVVVSCLIGGVFELQLQSLFLNICSSAIPQVQLDWTPVEAHEKLVPEKTQGLRQFRDHRWKALGEENPNLLGLFL